MARGILWSARGTPSPDLILAPAVRRAPPSARRPAPRSPSASRRPLARRRLALPPPVVSATAAWRPSRCASWSRARARATSATCVLQMWAYLAGYEMPNDDPEALERARPRRVPGPGRPARSAWARRRPCACSARSARPAASTPSRRCSSGRTGCGSWSRTGPSPYLLVRHPERFDAARRACTRRSTSG